MLDRAARPLDGLARPNARALGGDEGDDHSIGGAAGSPDAVARFSDLGAQGLA